MAVVASETSSPPLTILLFGPMHVLVHGRPLSHLRSRKSLWLLVLLALRHGRPIEREWLAGTLWPEMEASRGFTNLRVVLSELRRALGDQADRLLSPSRHTLALNLAGAEVDLVLFEAALASRQREALEQAVALYRGPLLEDCAEEWITGERRRCEQECLTALQNLADVALSSGDYRLAADYYRRAVSLDPWREAAQRSLMEALARSGDRNAALQVYREFRELLRSDPNALPDDETSALYDRLRAEARRQSRLQTDAATQETIREEVAARIVRGYLPHPLTGLIGRQEERSEVAERLRESRVVTLTGPGGIGKTRLALAVAAENTEDAVSYADGVWMVALEALSEGRLIAAQVASVLGVREETGRSLLESLIDSLRPKHLLLVLDNCEHLLKPCALFVAKLIRECPKVRILATSREALGIAGEIVWQAPALAAPDLQHLPQGSTTLLRVLAGYESVQLFVERAQACQKSFALSGSNAMAVAQVCAQLEGIPLAIEFAAARIKAMTVEQVVARLHDHLDLLTGGSRVATSRQQTLRTTLDWSYGLLQEPARLLLGRLSVFSGGWVQEAAQRVCAGEDLPVERIPELLTSLTDKSLVVYEERDGMGRYRLLEMVRQYAAEWLGPETPTVQTRHLDWGVALAEQAEDRLKGVERGVWLPRLEAERDNLRAALDRCEALGEAEASLRLVSALWRYWYIRGELFEARSALEPTLGWAGDRGTTAMRRKAVNAAGAAAFYQNDYDAAQVRFEKALHLSRVEKNQVAIADSLNNLGNVCLHRSDYEQAHAFYEESLSLYRALNDKAGIAKGLNNLGNVSRHLDITRQQTYYEESLDILRELGDQTSIGTTLMNLAMLTYRRGDFPTARKLGEECVERAQEAGDRSNLAQILYLLGNTCLMLEDYPASQSFYEESLHLSQSTGHRSMEAWGLMGLGHTAEARNDPSAARALFQQSRQRFAELGERNHEGGAINTEGNLAEKLGEAVAAQRLYQEAAALFCALRDAYGLEESVMGLANGFFLEGKIDPAVRRWAASHTMRESLSKPLVPADKKELYEQRLAQARLALGEDTFAVVWQEGCTLSWEQAGGV